MNKDKRRQIFARLQAADPNPTTELINRTPFELLVAVILSAQATDISVNKATPRLFPVANTPRAILELATIRLLVDAGVLVVCAGVGGAGYSSLERTTVIFSTCMSRMV